MIRLEDLRFCYQEGDFALSVPELRIERGERVAVIGPSGSGKTTLLHLIAGIATPERGRVHTGGVEVTALSDSARRDFRVRHIGLVFQEFELLLPYRINPSLRLAPAVRERADALAARLGIADRLGRLASQLSHGEKQRAAVCRALVAEPDLILADEPTGNLDPANKEKVLEILVEYAVERAATLVTVTHDHALLKRFERVIDFRSFHAPAHATPS